jgi:hypothetical protein
VPQKLATAAVVAAQLIEVLKQVETELLAFLQAVEPTLTQNLVSPRISIWVPDREGRVLEPTEFRYHYRHERTVPGRTRYSLTELGTGAPGRSFCSNDVVVVTRLPPYDSVRNRQRYLNRLREETGIDAAVVEAFSRHARSFIAVPFALTSDRPDGVVCIDCAVALNQVQKRHLLRFARQLRGYFTVTLAALWRLRLS